MSAIARRSVMKGYDRNSNVCTQLKNGFFVFLYHKVALYYVSQDFGCSIEVSAIARDKISKTL